MYAVIMAGGKGARFWPRSREKKPKHLLDITSEKTIIQETVDRIKQLIPQDNILVVTGKKHARTLIRQLPEIPSRNILIEPEGKNTAACIGLAALHIRKMVPDDVMVVLPSDHAIHDSQRFIDVIGAAAKVAAQEDALVTIGIKPTSIQTGFGYIEQADSFQRIGHEEIFRVKSIREKPDFQQAKEFIESGKFYWNSGMFIWKASTILKEIGRWLPALDGGLMKINEAIGSPREAVIVPRVYRKLASISIDYGVMEKADNVFMIQGDFGWSDVGSWDALWEISPKDIQGNAALGGSETIFEDSEGSLIYSPRKLVALVGIKDLIIVETKDALLICKKGSSQNVKKVVDILEGKKLKKYL
ncbi:MAG: mannose-1-phosphate guanylyltransferase [Deltaproteobacteria bacterium HGW-Deltaproteobacteria-13]|jgi:mannose-1-phosphate guanylyltransferase|nr:MAG: mannose-1-phosphate guanylyltransferase [Deltaproteobacteria bacterium HGW-Deltaproteobacteria-13]